LTSSHDTRPDARADAPGTHDDPVCVRERPLRILYLIDSLGAGGAQRQLVTLVTALDRTAISPEVAVYHPIDHFRPDLERTRTPIHVLGTRGARDPLVLARLARLVSRGEYDIVHSFLKTPGVLARLAVGGRKGRAVGRREGRAGVGRTKPVVVVSERSTNIASFPFRLYLERRLALRADAMIANGRSVAQSVEDAVPAWRGRISVVPNGIEWSEPDSDLRDRAERFRRLHLGPAADTLLGVVGRIEKAKNPLLLVDALARLPKELLKRTRIVWVGPWNDRRLVESVGNLVRQRHLEKNFELLSRTSEVRSVYLALDGFVLPSEREGFPNVVLEALADGLPVVATDVGDTGMLVETGRNGWLVRSQDPGALSRAIRELIEASPERRRELGRAGTSVREEHSAARLAERTIAVYRGVLRRGRGDSENASGGASTGDSETPPGGASTEESAR
jgi:glycosyltransferase involved in cell wall biosynthesis